jgi:hypothetical protein
MWSLSYSTGQVYDKGMQNYSIEKHPLPRRTILKRSKEEAEQKLVKMASRGNASNQEFVHITVQ